MNTTNKELISLLEELKQTNKNKADNRAYKNMLESMGIISLYSQIEVKNE